MDVPRVKVWLSRSEVRDEGRSGVDGREGGLERVTDVDGFDVEYSITKNTQKLGIEGVSENDKMRSSYLTRVRVRGVSQTRARTSHELIQYRAERSSKFANLGSLYACHDNS